MLDESNKTFESKLWQEQFNAMDRAFKFEERKCIFVVALFSAGGISSVPNIPDDFAYLYFLIPLAAIGFDALILSQKYAVMRIGCFLSENSNYDMEREWEKFVANHREGKMRIGTEIFTALSFGASFMMLLKIKYHGNIEEVPSLAFLWFVLLLTISRVSNVSRNRQIANLDKNE